MNSIYANKVFLEPNYVVFMIDSLFLSVCDRPMNFSCKKLCVDQHVKDRIDQIVLYQIINLIHGCSSNLILYMYRKVYAFSHASTNVSSALTKRTSQQSTCAADLPKERVCVKQSMKKKPCE